jgi:hypothetical protein
MIRIWKEAVMAYFQVGDAGSAYRDWGKPEIYIIIEFQIGQSLLCVNTSSKKS